MYGGFCFSNGTSTGDYKGEQTKLKSLKFLSRPLEVKKVIMERCAKCIFTQDACVYPIQGYISQTIQKFPTIFTNYSEVSNYIQLINFLSSKSLGHD